MKRKNRGVGERWVCTKDRPMPAEEDPAKWSHTYKTIESATFWDKLECEACGHQVLASPKP